MKEDKSSHTNDTDRLMPTDDEQQLMRMAMGRSTRPTPDVDAEWEKFVAANTEQPADNPWIKPLAWLSAVAAAVVAIFLIAWPTTSERRQEAYVAVENLKREVTIETGDSEPAVVTERRLDFSNTATVSGTAENTDVQKTTIATSRGMDFGLTLPDGTEVWLNAESRITFANDLGISAREVTVEGEAYFDVKKDAAHPFIVRTKYFTTKVLGTSFDVKAYREETAHVVLVSGKVEVTAGDKPQQTLSPGEMVSIGDGGLLQKASVDTYSYIQWKDGFFYFDRTSLGDIMRELGRWYNINIVFENPSLMGVRLHFVAEKSQSINDIVSSLNAVSSAHLTIGDNEITIEEEKK
ncbi:MAG: FecR family protein [Prevotella sp.]